MDRPERTLTFAEQPGGLTARAGWTWMDAEDGAERCASGASSGASSTEDAEKDGD